ncbi:MAG: nuclear transport factor 2 family protein [Pseudomonadota bacterium]
MDVKTRIEAIYADYANRNIAGVLDAIPDDFCFEWPVDPAHAAYAGVCGTKAELLAQLQSLAERFTFNRYAATNIVVDGDRVAAQVALNLTSHQTGDTFDATIAHFWTFESGTPVKLVEYMDSALMKHQCGTG